MSEILTTQLIDTLLNDERVTQLSVIQQDEYTFTYLTGPSGKKVSIFSSQEFITEMVAANHIVALGVADLINLILPGFLDRHAAQLEAKRTGT